MATWFECKEHNYAWQAVDDGCDVCHGVREAGHKLIKEISARMESHFGCRGHRTDCVSCIAFSQSIGMITDMILATVENIKVAKSEGAGA